MTPGYSLLIKVRSVETSSRHPCTENWVTIWRAVVYHARAAHAFSAGTECRHCSTRDRQNSLFVPQLAVLNQLEASKSMWYMEYCTRLESLFSELSKPHCITVACLPPIRGLEKCRVIGHNPHFPGLCFLSWPNLKGVTQGSWIGLHALRSTKQRRERCSW